MNLRHRWREKPPLSLLPGAADVRDEVLKPDAAKGFRGHQALWLRALIVVSGIFH